MHPRLQSDRGADPVLGDDGSDLLRLRRARAYRPLGHDGLAATRCGNDQMAFGIVNDLAQAGYVVKDRDDRRNRYRVQHHLPLPLRFPRAPTIGDVLAVLVDTGATEPTQTAKSDGRSRPRSRQVTARTTKAGKPG